MCPASSFKDYNDYAVHMETHKNQDFSFIKRVEYENILGWIKTLLKQMEIEDPVMIRKNVHSRLGDLCPLCWHFNFHSLNRSVRLEKYFIENRKRYYISERDQAVKNLKSHIKNHLEYSRKFVCILCRFTDNIVGNSEFINLNEDFLRHLFHFHRINVEHLVDANQFAVNCKLDKVELLITNIMTTLEEEKEQSKFSNRAISL